jgi:hypothetical protein
MTMKKLATVLAAAVALTFATPAFACPHGEKSQDKTAEKKADDKAKTTDTAKKEEPAKKEQPKKEAPKTADSGKVSSK